MVFPALLDFHPPDGDPWIAICHLTAGEIAASPS
jgi:hypothetical protein